MNFLDSVDVGAGRWGSSTPADRHPSPDDRRRRGGMVTTFAATRVAGETRRFAANRRAIALYCRASRGRSSAVERQPSKLNVEGSIPFARFVNRGASAVRAPLGAFAKPLSPISLAA